jgi:hypothetical protein
LHHPAAVTIPDSDRTALLGVAIRLGEAASDLQDRARAIRNAAHSITWSSYAANEFRRGVDAVTATLILTAQAFLDAAERLR